MHLATAEIQRITESVCRTRSPRTSATVHSDRGSPAHEQASGPLGRTTALAVRHSAAV